MFELSCNASCNRASKSRIFSDSHQWAEVKRRRVRKRTFFCIRITLVHFLTRRPLLFCPRSGWKSVYRGSEFAPVGSYRTYEFRILLELLEGLREAGVLEIVEDRLVSVRGLIGISKYAGHVGTCDTYRSSVCRSDNKIDIIKSGLEGEEKGCCRRRNQS